MVKMTTAIMKMTTQENKGMSLLFNSSTRGEGGVV